MAALKLMQQNPNLPENHTLHNYKYQGRYFQLTVIKLFTFLYVLLDRLLNLERKLLLFAV